MTNDNIITWITSCNADTWCWAALFCTYYVYRTSTFQNICVAEGGICCIRNDGNIPGFLYSYILFLKQHYRTIIFGPQDDRCYAATGLPTFSFGVVVACRRLISLRPVDMRLPCFRQWLQNVLIMDTLRVWLMLSRSSIRFSVTWLYHRPNEVERAWVGGLGGL